MASAPSGSGWRKRKASYGRHGRPLAEVAEGAEIICHGLLGLHGLSTDACGCRRRADAVFARRAWRGGRGRRSRKTSGTSITRPSTKNRVIARVTRMARPRPQATPAITSLLPCRSTSSFSRIAFHRHVRREHVDAAPWTPSVPRNPGLSLIRVIRVLSVARRSCLCARS